MTRIPCKNASACTLPFAKSRWKRPRAFHDDWVESYEREDLVKGCRLPWMGSALLARHLVAGSGLMLDAGCGAGLVGDALSVLGDGSIIGCYPHPG
ncbi:MAG: hypothetical protein JNN02_10020 [Tabrizicola sp.]|nr:hypothetical protein [Tabrizicola sp.]